MKRRMVFWLAVIMAVSIVGCGGNTNKEPEKEPEPSIGDQMYEKYGTIIDKLEEENYDGAIEEIQAMKPLPVVLEMEITKENFNDYYDLVFLENEFDRDADGKIVSIRRYDYMFGFKLKDGYVLDADQDNTIEIGVTCEYDLKRIEEVNFETGEIVLGDEVYDELEDRFVSRNEVWTNDGTASLSTTCKGSDRLSCNGAPTVVSPLWHDPESEIAESEGMYNFLGITPDDQEGYLFVPVDIQITRAEGTLHLVNE